MAMWDDRLDNRLALEPLDSGRMLDITADLPQQFAAAQRVMADTFLPPNFPIPRKLLIQGTGGGSGAAAAVVQQLFASQLECPIVVNQGYQLPAWVDKQTLVVFLSFSGNTEEIISTYEQAQATPARLIAITAGGELAIRCQNSATIRIPLPPEPMQARSAIAYLFVPFIWLFERLGFIDASYRRSLPGLIRLLEELTRQYQLETPTSQNLAKQIAIHLENHLPVIYSSDTYWSAVALRWRNQFNENSKTLAHFNTLPQMNHDEIVGWEHAGPLLQSWQPIFLRDPPSEDPRITQRIGITQETIEQTLQRQPLEVYARGETLLERIFSLMFLGDWVSIYLAFLYRVDPTPVPSIVGMKARLKQIGSPP